MMRKAITSLALVLISCLSLNAQQIQGTVKDSSTGDPLIGASVRNVTQGKGNITDTDGKFIIDATSGDKLQVSYIGYQASTITVGDADLDNVLLSVDASELEEVVVIGYGVEKKRLAAGAVSKVDAEAFEKSVNANVNQAIQGKVSGVTVISNSGSPGSEAAIRIRGISTTGNPNPLYVVDGIIVEDITGLNDDDIESIDILKDASASIYGVRSGNGVVFITTKKGKKNSQQISWNSSIGIQNVANTQDVLNATQYAALINEKLAAGGNTPLFTDPLSFGEGTDWQNALFTSVPISQHNLSFRKGWDKTTIALSGSLIDQEGIVGEGKSAYNRYTGRLNVTHQLTPKFDLDGGIYYASEEKNNLTENTVFGSPVGRALNMDPITTVGSEGNYNQSQYVANEIVNPLLAIDDTHNTSFEDRTQFRLRANYKPIEGLTLSASGSYDVLDAENLTFVPEFFYNTTVQNSRSSYNLNDYDKTEYLTEGYANYTKSLNEEHNLDFLLGTSYNEWEVTPRFAGGAASGPSFDLIDFTDGYTTLESPKQQVKTFSGFGRLKYDFKERYIVSATFRRDGSSIFGPERRFGNFPSVSAAWVASDEAFLQNSLPFLDYLKVRGSWGRGGNDRIPLYQYVSLVNRDVIKYTFGDEVVFGAAALVASNPELGWEVNTQSNIGVDLYFLENRLSVTADYFEKKTTDILYAPASAGLEGNLNASPFQNVGEIENRGLELELGLKGNGALKYNVRLNGTYLKNEVTQIDGLDNTPFNAGFYGTQGFSTTRMEVGKPLGHFYGRVTDGVFQNQGEIAAHASQPNAQPGDIRFKDINGDGVIDDDDRTMIGNPYPEWLLGFNFDLSVKQFDLTTFTNASIGNDLYTAFQRSDLITANLPAAALDRWTGPGTSYSEPRLTSQDLNGNSIPSDRFIEDGSYLRLKTVQLGYSVPDSAFGNSALSALRVYLSGQNLWTLTDYSGYDPEVGSTGGVLDVGVDRGFYPQARSFIMGLNLKF